MVNGFKRGSHFWVNYELAIFTIKMRDFIKKKGKTNGGIAFKLIMH